MALKCCDCGHIFEVGEQAIWSESRGEFWGTPCSEEVRGCPLCRGDYAEAKPCNICGSEHFLDELTEGVCEECIDNYKKDFKFCNKIAQEWEKEGNSSACDFVLNDFFAIMFTKEQIENMLIEYIQEKMPNLDCSKFVESDIEWFCEMAKEVKKNENAKG
jgi:hypothetical protein